jgi:ribosomal RNA-processing protein 1
VSELDMLKLWKGIYFCFWHSDKEPVQVGCV